MPLLRLEGADTIAGFFNSYERNKQTPQQLQQLKIERPVSEYSDGPPCIELNGH